MAGDLTLRFQRGEVVIEVRGDAEAVQTVFSDLKASGIGTLATFFGFASPIGIGTQPGRTQPLVGQPIGGQPIAVTGPTAPLANPAASFRFVIDSLTLPTNQRPSADDVDGDGRTDNAFANIVRSFDSLQLNFQGEIDSELKAGHLILLLTVETEFATPGPDQRAAVTLLSGKPVNQSGHIYVIDPSTPPVTLQGRIVAGRFASDDPRISGPVAHRDIPLSFGPNAHATLPIQGLRLTFDISVDGSVISNGQLTGSLKQADVRSQLVPAFAIVLTGLIQNAAGSPTAQNIQNLFDKGGCTNPDGTLAQAGDGVIDVCEVLTNPLMMSLLQPDVQIYDAQGKYAPNPLGGNPDSTSIGLGLSATRASY
jgi:hypothetical protein